MTCTQCGGNMVEREIRFCVCNITPPIIIENVPAYVCATCGVEVFSDATMEVFEQIRDGHVPNTGTVVVSVFDFQRTSGEQETELSLLPIPISTGVHSRLAAV